ncbi:MAG: C4-dicarboxylate ABC transporter permease [Phycisphaerae bacterium SM23_30]|nr:MAG: C4-dicarboxylate ABC transporter permease [Phycisphaerae bacterium SM23_30]
MDWHLFLVVLFGSLLGLMMLGIPVAFAFLIIVIVGAPLTWGIAPGMTQIMFSISANLMNFSFLPIPLFILMGEIIFHSKIAPAMIDALDKWIGRLPGRLSLMSVGAGMLFSTLTGTSIASTAMLGGTLIPEMENRGYKKPMTIGPILGSGSLALLIPPSGLAVLLGAIGEISIGRILIAIIVPGVIMALFYVAYIVIRCMIQPSLAPSYQVEATPLSEKLSATVRYILPVGFIIFMVIGVIYAGIATPTEAAATGALGCYLFALVTGRLTWEVAIKSLNGTVRVTVMLLMIVSTSDIFSQIMSYSGAVNELVDFVLAVPAHRMVILIGMQLILMMLGMFMNSQAIMMITLPIFMPVVEVLEFDTIWFAVIYLLNMEIATMTPPFGLALFVMKGVAPKDTNMTDIWRAAVPFLMMDTLIIVIIMVFPDTALWLVRSMR